MKKQLLLMQRYVDPLPIPNNQPESSLICCDTPIISRQSREIALDCAVKS